MVEKYVQLPHDTNACGSKVVAGSIPGYNFEEAWNMPNGIGLQRPNAKKYNKILTIGLCVDEGRPRTIGYVCWRKRDNHKICLVRGRGATLTSGPVLAQRKHTDIAALAASLGMPGAKLVLRQFTGINGGRCVGAPKFVSGSVARNRFSI